ncbi:exodeoxyribonuclease VII large subunit [Pelagibius sp.]|uniref:exodeoxyribonuclease VII large subunit n=1 Tax=Pelagibius sp. TaxID=1931238 RepID=UPI00261497D1|nr:exodeoxyribonuclease VII large subunit [Pelagibius sp.]
MPASPSISNVPEFSVSEISQAVKRTLEGTFERVRVRGEISGFKRAASGHLYLALKDENAVLDGVCWRGTAGRLAIQPEDGMEVIASGRITSYPGRSKYQIVIEALELAGQGALLKLLEERRRKLAEEGLFDEARKRPLPFLPGVIGVVTSPSGAVIRDILHRLADRFPRRVLVWPVLVQGEGAAAQVAAAIRGFNALPEAGEVPRPDLLIVARGGGSLEDLWSFNEEVVVRAAADSEIPLISAVGHETDTTLIDFAADRRAPTPTAAAEMAVPVRRELLLQVSDLDRRLLAAANRLMDERRTQVEGLGRGLVDPRRLLEELTQRLDERVERLRAAWTRLLKDGQAQVARLQAALPHPRQLLTVKREQLAAAAGRLETLQPRLLSERRGEVESLGRVLESISYKNVLQRGYAVVRGPEGAITSAAAVQPGQALRLEFADGTAAATGGSANPENPQKPKPAAKPRKAGPAKDDPQGSLL